MLAGGALKSTGRCVVAALCCVNLLRLHLAYSVRRIFLRGCGLGGCKFLVKAGLVQETLISSKVVSRFEDFKSLSP